MFTPSLSHACFFHFSDICSLGSLGQGSFFWLQNTEGEPVVGVFATNHQPQVLPPYFAVRKKNHGLGSNGSTKILVFDSLMVLECCGGCCPGSYINKL
jgi:hypothetical protein